MDRILDLYGYKTKHGFMCCPFHGEKEPSLKVYKATGGWHCFGCERGGSVIDFVMEHEGCNFHTAVRAIDQALNLGLMSPKEHPEDARQEKRIQQALDNFCEAVYAYCDLLVKMIEHKQEKDYKKLKQLEELQYGQAEKLTADDCTFLMTWKEEAQYLDFQADMVREFREEVAQWRRSRRRAK